MVLIKLKTLKGDTFDLEVASDELIGSVKEKVAASETGVKGGWEAAGVKLIFQGKVLDNDKDVTSYGIKENEFMVVMASKPKATPAPAAALPAPAAPVPAAPPAAVASGPATPAPAAPAPAAAAQPQSQFSPDAQAAITSLCEMGYERSEVEAAMIAAFMNPDRAAQFLEDGLPNAPMDDSAAEADAGPTPTTWAELAASVQFRREIMAIGNQGVLQTYLQGLASADPAKLQLIQSNPNEFAALLNAMQQQAAGGGAPPGGDAAPLPFGQAALGGGGGGGAPAGLQALLQNPQALQALMQNPQALEQMMQNPEMAAMMQQPEVLHMIQQMMMQDPAMLEAMQNPEMMAQLGEDNGDGGVNPVLAQLNGEDEQAIERLMALGFPRPVCIQAFLACDKNENLAANFLFDQGADLM